MNSDAASLMAGTSVRSGPCALGDACTAKDQELSDQYRCRNCNRQLHGFLSDCSQAKNPKDFRDGVICKNQPCYQGELAPPIVKPTERTDGAAIAAAAGLPKFLWETQQPKRKRDPNAPKQKRQRYTKQHKEMVLETLNNTDGARVVDISKQFNIPEGTVRGWYDEDRRRKAAEGGVPTVAAGPPFEMGDITEHMLDPSEGAPSGETNPPEATATDQALNPSPPKRSRKRYSNETKIQVILALETRPNVSLNEVAKEFKVAPGTVRGWREEADKIQKQAMENRRVGAKANPSRDPLRRIWDSILNLFEKNSRLPIQQRLEVNVAVVRTIGKQARDILLESHAKKAFLTQVEVNNMEKFKASETWARKWARDHQVISAKPETSNQVDIAQNRVIHLQRIITDYPPSQVYSMTSTALFYRILPHRTYVSKLATQKRVRACKGLKSKDRLTLYICANETGTDKLPIACIGKYERPACFQVAAQKNLPYLSQKQALSDAGTFQKWWRTVFLPHVRTRFDEGEKCLLLVEDMGPCKAELLKDPTGQIRVEALPASPSNTMAMQMPKEAGGNANSQTANLPQCQAFEYGILETIKRRYRYRLLQEVMDAFDERAMRRQVADNADFPMGSRGLREGSLANLSDAMRLLEAIWNEVATTTIVRSWQKTKLRPKSKDELALPAPRAKSEKRQTTREKKQLIRDLETFLTKHEAKDFSKEGGADHLEEMIEKLKNCFLYTDGEVIESKEMMESLEEWIGLEGSIGMIALFMEEIKQEMNIEYLVGLKEPIEGTVAEADEGEDDVLPPPSVPPETPSEGRRSKYNKEKEKELDLETAITLATTIKTTAAKLFSHGDILGELAVRLDDASDSVFRLLRKQKEEAAAKIEAEEAKAAAKLKLAKRAAAKAAQAATAGDTPADSTTEVAPAMANEAMGDAPMPGDAATAGANDAVPGVNLAATIPETGETVTGLHPDEIDNVELSTDMEMADV